MNLIPCDKDCINQVEGYCNLAGITNVTGTTEKAAFTIKKAALGENKEMLPAHILKSLRNRPESD